MVAPPVVGPEASESRGTMGRSTEMWSQVRSGVSGAARRVDPVVLFGLGVLIVAALFGALAVTVLGGADGADDLGLGAPGASPPEWGDTPGGGDVAGGGQGDDLAHGLSARVPGPGASTTVPTAPEGVAAGQAAGAPWPATTRPSAGGPGAGTSTTAPEPAATTSSTTAPTTTTTTAPADRGLFRSLLDLLNPGG